MPKPELPGSKSKSKICYVCRAEMQDRRKHYFFSGMCRACGTSLEEWQSAHGLTSDILWAVERAWRWSKNDSRKKALCDLLFGDESVTSGQFCDAEARIEAEARVAELELPRWLYLNQGGALVWQGRVTGTAWPANGVYYATTVDPYYSFPDTFIGPREAFEAVEMRVLGKPLAEFLIGG